MPPQVRDLLARHHRRRGIGLWRLDAQPVSSKGSKRKPVLTLSHLEGIARRVGHGRTRDDGRGPGGDAVLGENDRGLPACRIDERDPRAIDAYTGLAVEYDTEWIGEYVDLRVAERLPVLAQNGDDHGVVCHQSKAAIVGRGIARASRGRDFAREHSAVGSGFEDGEPFPVTARGRDEDTDTIYCQRIAIGRRRENSKVQLLADAKRVGFPNGYPRDRACVRITLSGAGLARAPRNRKRRHYAGTRIANFGNDEYGRFRQFEGYFIGVGICLDTFGAPAGTRHIDDLACQYFFPMREQRQ